MQVRQNVSPPPDSARHASDDLMPEQTRSSSDIHDVLDRNIQALLDQRKQEEAKLRLADRTARLISDFAGSMSFVCLHLAILAVWIAWNIGLVPGVRPWDPTFVMLAMAASVEAIFLSAFVLITQNRMAVQSARKAELDLQINLLNERETTKLIEMVATLCDRLDQPAQADAELHQLRQNVDPAKVLAEIERAESRS